MPPALSLQRRRVRADRRNRSEAPMKLLRRLQFTVGKAQKSIELLSGDLSHIPMRHAVDALIISAFAGDFVPTASSLVGALDRVGLSVAELFERKAVDLRQQYGSWLS